ncbi:hypothetical protein [Yeguia hominis]|uniref:Transglutaminase domain-containing protein n=1 Tax=Yeguia hominis TaxID=2763662 RepID=A0A926HSJ0_9FIRM|nr:hypothetical protein [Yeguia hominis]MBC8533885.1 transglutaminase domain-containing protein [Yeguia hominis]
MKQTATRVLCACLAAVLLCLTAAGCTSAEKKQEAAYCAQVSTAITDTEAYLQEILSMADSMIGKTSVVLSDNANAEGLEVIEEYAELCRSNGESLEERTGAIRKISQELARCEVPKTERAQAVSEAQTAYFEEVFSVLDGIGETLAFYVAQYDASMPLFDAMTTEASDRQSYLSAVYDAALTVSESYAALELPSYLTTLWPRYNDSCFSVFLKYMESEYAGIGQNDVLRLYSASQLIQRMSIVSLQYDEKTFSLMERAYTHGADLISENLLVFGQEIRSACEGGALPQEGYLAQPEVMFRDYTMASEIYPNLYPSMDSIVNLLLYTDKGMRQVFVTAEVAGFTQKYEQKLTLTPEMTYLMIKPPVLSEMPDLSTTKDTQLTLTITDAATGEVLEQESQTVKLYSVYDYKTYSDEFGVIQNDNVLAWLTPESDGVLAVRRNAVEWLEQTQGREYGILPGYQYAYGFGEGEESAVTYYEVAALQSAISNMGVRYNMGAYSLNATQRVLMPDAVLASKSGICIETAVLMASALQSADMHAMIVFTPGHAQVAVETWQNSGQYFLIETTLLPFEATKEKLNTLITQLDSQGWADYLAQNEQRAQESGGMVYIVDCDLLTTLGIQGLNY